MGQDKALLAFGGGSLLAHALQRLRAITPDVRILAGAAPRYQDQGIPILCDLVPDAGPLGGLLTALSALEAPAALLLAVGLPLVPVALLSHLVQLAPGFDAVVPHSATGPEPLCAVYANSCLDAVRHQVGTRDLSMTSFWPAVRVREVTVAEVRAFGAPERLFRNLNRPSDYQDLGVEAGESPPPFAPR
jgi:molybdopterin-guanine dinucleotide biosynthesis protein A